MVNLVESRLPLTVGAGAFSGEKFYYAIASGPYVAGQQQSTISATTAGGASTAVAQLTGRVDELRVTADTIYAAVDLGPETELAAFSLNGEPLPAPSQEEAFPPVTSRVSPRGDTLVVDGVILPSTVYAFAETSDGVYFVPAVFPNSISYVSFEDLSSEKAVVVRHKGQLINLWVSGNDIYARLIEQNPSQEILT